MKNIAKNKYLIILTIIVIILTIIKLFFSNSSSPTLDSTTTKPGQSSSLSSPDTNNINSNSQPNDPLSTAPSKSNPTSTPSSSNQITEVNYQIPLAKFLPYQGKYFRAQRYIGANNLEIIVSRQDQTDLAKQEAQVWFVQNGVDQLDRFTVTYR
jgi:hypothetical protein